MNLIGRNTLSRLFALLISVTLLPLATVSAASPALSALTPRGGQRGTEVEVTLNGGRLEDAQQIMFYETGIEVSNFEVVNASTVKVTFKIAPDCELGSHRFRIRTATGISDLQPFMVGALPSVNEVEPNSDFKEPQPIPMNSTVFGVVQNEDVDYYIIDAKKGDRITAEVEAIRLGISLFDVYVAIMSSARFELDASDDNALVWQDGIASIVAPEDGQYIIQVRDSAFGGNGNCHYRAHIGNFPRPVATLPAGGKVGETVSVKLLGDVTGERDQTFTLPTEGGDFHHLFPNDDLGIAPSANWFRLSQFGNVIEQEPNETHETATPFTPPIALNGVVSSPEDVDYFKFTATKGQVFDVRVHARNVRSPLDSVLTISRLGGGAVASNDDSGGPDSFIRFTAPNDGEFVIHVRDHLGNGGPIYAYRVELSPVQPKLTLSVDEFVRYVQPTVSIPRGNRFALMLNASRVDFRGDLAILAENLPEGVTMESPGMPASLNTVPVIFTATPEANIAGALADIRGKLNDPMNQAEIEGRLIQDVVMVRGQNQRPFYTESVERLATAVTEESPFSVELIQPKVPVVRGGSMQLKVVATRKEGFTAPIKVGLLWFPPGINASRSISIAEGQTEALIPLNAAGNAQIADWQIAVTGQATVGNGPLMVSTQFATLKVAEQYLTFAYENAAVEQAQETEIVVKVTHNTPFEGEATVTMVGLPNKATTEPTVITKDTEELIFKIKTEMDTPAGNHKNLFCQVIVTENGEPIAHNLGSGLLRVDVPLPPKKDEPKPAPMPVAEKPPEPKAAPPMKRLTRLEQLRLEQKEREEALKAGSE